MPKFAGEDVMVVVVVGEMGQGMIVAADQSLQLEEPIVTFGEDSDVRSLMVGVAIESHKHRLDSYMAVLKQEMVAN
jgi:hypothetical protein